MVIQTWVSAHLILKMEGVNLSLQETQLSVFVANSNIWTLKWTSEFQKLVSNIQNSFLMKSAKIEMNVIFKLFYNEMCQYLKDLYNSGNQVFRRPMNNVKRIMNR